MVKTTETGRVLAIQLPELTEDEETRFWAKVEKTDNCWHWKAAVNSSGYGNFCLSRRHGRRITASAHRVSFHLAGKPMAEDLVLDHLCRNRLCVNPDHLEQVTNRINTMRGDSPTATNATKTSCSKGHLLSGDNLYIEEAKDGTIRRKCQTCRRAARAKIKDARKSAERKPKPTEDVLKQHIEDGMAWTRIGELYGVSDNAARKWAKNYGLL